MIFTDTIRRAINTSATLHKDQLRKNEDTPYVSHVYAVAFILAQYTDDEDIVVAGLLHDVLEDVPKDIYDEAMMRKDFGDRVTDIVKGVTENKSISTYRKRKQHYLDQLADDQLESVIVSAADMMHNMLSLTENIQHLGQEGYNYYKNWPDRLWFYRMRAQIIKQRLNSPLANKAEGAYIKLAELAKRYAR